MWIVIVIAIVLVVNQGMKKGWWANAGGPKNWSQLFLAILLGIAIVIVIFNMFLNASK